MLLELVSEINHGGSSDFKDTKTYSASRPLVRCYKPQQLASPLSGGRATVSRKTWSPEVTRYPTGN